MWSDKHLAVLKTEAGLGLTAAQIGAKLGRSRNAVIGIIRRRGIAWNHAKPPVPKLRIVKRLQRGKASPGVMDARLFERMVRRLGRNPELPPGINPQEAPPIEETTPGNVGLTELRHHHCRYPIGDPATPEFRYCGLTRLTGKPYCATHERLCHERWRW